MCGLTKLSVAKIIQCRWWIRESGALLDLYAEILGENSAQVSSRHVNPGLLSERPVTACLSCAMIQMFLFSASPTLDPGCTVYNAMGTGGSVGRDSAVCITAGYGLDGPGIDSRWGARFSAPVQTGPRTQQPYVQWVPGFLTRGKASGAWR